jgi:hypothetical protein
MRFANLLLFETTMTAHFEETLSSENIPAAKSALRGDGEMPVLNGQPLNGGQCVGFVGFNFQRKKAGLYTLRYTCTEVQRKTS